MGFIAGICSRDQSDVSELLYKMTMKLKHRGNSEFCLFNMANYGRDMIKFENPNEILSLKTSFGVIGRHLYLNEGIGEIPYQNCLESKFLLLDGVFLNPQKIKQELQDDHKKNLLNPSILLHLMDELQKRLFDFSVIFGKIYSLIEGMFAAVLILKNHVFILRDLIGTKPLYLYVGPKYIAFASEKKALWSIGFTQRIEALQPGRVVRFAEKGFTSHYQADFKINNIQEREIGSYQNFFLETLNYNIAQMNPKIPHYLLLSGGIDSTLLAALMRENELNFKSLVLGTQKSKDIQISQKVAEELGLYLETLEFDSRSLETVFPALLYAIESRDEKQLNIAFPLFYASNYLKKKNQKIIFTGQGADEIFGGYERHEIQFQEDPAKLNDMLLEDVRNLSIVNLERDDAASMAHGIELRLPYLSRGLIECSLRVPAKFKIHGTTRKYILRKLGKGLGLPDSVTQQPKRAIQFSSGSYSTLKKLAGQFGFTKDFALKQGFFSPTQLFIDSLASFLGFPDNTPEMVKFTEQTQIEWPESFQKFENIVNKIV